MSLEGKSLCVLAPMYGGQCSFNYHLSFAKLVEVCLMKYKVPLTWMVCMNGSIISVVRNQLVSNFLKHTKSTHALLVDTDIGFVAEDIVGMLETDYDVIGVPCTRKTIRWDRVQKAIKKADHDLMPKDLSAAAGDPVGVYENAIDLDVYAPQPMHRLGTGLLMVKREVFEVLEDAFPNRWYYAKSDVIGFDSLTHEPVMMQEKISEIFTLRIDPDSREFIHEDYGFCKDCRVVGVNPVMFPWIKTTHWGGHLFVGDLPEMAALVGEV